MTTPVNKVNGIGPKTNEYLKGKGVTTAEALLKFGVDKLVLAPGFSQGRAATVINEAGKLISGAQTIAEPEKTKKPDKVKSRKGKKDKKDKKKNKDKKSKGKKGKDKKNKKNKKEKKNKNK